MFALAGVPQVWDVVRGVKVHLDRLRRLHLQHVMTNPEIVEEHARIVEALETRATRCAARRSSPGTPRGSSLDAAELRAEYPEYFPCVERRGSRRRWEHVCSPPHAARRDDRDGIHGEGAFPCDGGRPRASSISPSGRSMSVIVGTDLARTSAAAGRFGWESASTDWREVVERDDIDVVDICSPGDTHAEIASPRSPPASTSCARSRSRTASRTRERMADAAAAASDLVTLCGFSYRRTPALALARRLIADGRIGEVRHVRAQYLQDWLSDAERPGDLAAGPGSRPDRERSATSGRTASTRPSG